jgi:pyruvate carboxylase subunit B
MGIAKSEEDILTYILYPAIAPKFLKGEMEEEALTVVAPAPAAPKEYAIPTHFKVEVDDEVYEVKIEPIGGRGFHFKASPKKPSAESIKGGVSCQCRAWCFPLKLR